MVYSILSMGKNQVDVLNALMALTVQLVEIIFAILRQILILVVYIQQILTVLILEEEDIIPMLPTLCAMLYRNV